MILFRVYGVCAHLRSMPMAYSDEDASTAGTSSNCFKAKFKYYKKRDPSPTLSQVLDLRVPNDGAGISVRKLSDYCSLQRAQQNNVHNNLAENCQGSGQVTEIFQKLGLRPLDDWSVSTIHSRPGLLLLSNIFAGSRDHLKWMKRTILPTELVSLTKTVAAALGYISFEPEAVIVNYYPPKSTLSGHVDRSEKNLDMPLFSFSFGQSAVFLSGGLTLNDEPLPIFLRSGDVLVMSASQRLVYHGVPKIIAHTTFDNNESEFDDTVVDYANRNRINITVRQVN